MSRIADLLARYAELLNAFGPDSKEERRFVRIHRRDNPEFVELAAISRRLKAAFLAHNASAEQ